MNRLQEKYNKEVMAALQKELGITNIHALPKIEKIVINAGLSKSLSDPTYIDTAVSVIERVSGQRPIKTLARKSISNFKIREGMVVGAKVTLRGERMWAFLDKLINVAFPRVRDFQGMKRNAFDGKGNYSIGFKEHIVFPEIASDEAEKLVGFEINIVTKGGNDASAEMLLEHLGFPFKKKN